MKENLIENRTFDKIDFTSGYIFAREYENCKFINCNFYQADLSTINFSDCLFSACNVSVATVSKTSFRKITFKDCKLLGLQFYNCNEFLFDAGFENCTLNLSSFFKMRLKKMKFNNCSMQEVDFSQADLSGSFFINCDLSRAVFDGTNLEKSDLRTSYNFTIDPERNKIKKARFSNAGLAGLLGKYDIIIE